MPGHRAEEGLDMKRDPKKKRPTVEDEVRELGRLVAGPLDPAALESLRLALQSVHGRVVARAARIVKERRQEGFAADLVGAFDGFRDAPPKSDPGCAAKLAVLEALDFTGYSESQIFLDAARMVQLEPAWGPPVDAAGPLRARAILALANIGYADILLLAGELLADGEAIVRQATAEALAHCGARAGAGLLLLALARSGEDPLVQGAYLSALLELAPDWALPRLRKLLAEGDSSARELAATVLGQSRREDSLDLLLEFVDRSPLASERAVILEAVGLHRSERALESLLGIIRTAREADAGVAVKALGCRKYEARVRERVRETVSMRSDATVEKAFIEAFAEAEA